MIPDKFNKDNPECQTHDHVPGTEECLVIDLEPICGKPENHNNGDDTCLECLAIENNI